MPKKKKTLAQQYEEQLKRIEERLIEMQKRGYTVVGDFEHYVPKKVTQKMIDDLKAITPKSLARLSDKNFTIDIGTKKQLIQKVKQSKKIDYRKKPISVGPPLEESDMIFQRILNVLDTPYNTGLNIPPWQYTEHITDIRELLKQVIAQIGKKTVIHRFAMAGEVAVEAVEGYVYSSDSEPIHIMSWYTFVDILTAGNIPEEINEKITELSDWRESE